MSKLSIAVLLSGREQFSVYYGGALARWTYEVYSRLQDYVDVKVLGFPTDSESEYPLPFETSAWSRLCGLMSRVPVARRYEDLFWLRSLMSRLQGIQVIHIHNRPQWAGMLRRLGYRGAMIVHLHNDHLGHWSSEMLDALAPELDGLVTCSSYLRDVSDMAICSTGTQSQGRSQWREYKRFLSTGKSVASRKPFFLSGASLPQKVLCN